jgi:hypothetical protein
MARKPLDWNPPETLTDEWIEYVDSYFHSPAEQGTELLQQLSDPWDNPWKLIMFAVEILGNVAIPMFTPDAPIVRDITAVGQSFYALHYFKAPEIYDLQRVSKEEVDSNGILPQSQAGIESPDISPSGSDSPDSGS